MPDSIKLEQWSSSTGPNRWSMSDHLSGLRLHFRPILEISGGFCYNEMNYY